MNRRVPGSSEQALNESRNNVQTRTATRGNEWRSLNNTFFRLRDYSESILSLARSPRKTHLTGFAQSE
jgi:hypothetical protein